MKNKMLIIFALGLAACSSCTAPKPEIVSSSSSSAGCDEVSCPAPIPDAGPTDEVISQDNWQFTLPGTDWESQPLPDEVIKVFYKNSVKTTNVLFVKEPTTYSFDEYTLSQTRLLLESGLVIDYSQRVTINGNMFALLQAESNGAMVWAWVSTKNEFGYVFVCGSYSNINNSSVHDLCNDISQTVQIQ